MKKERVALVVFFIALASFAAAVTIAISSGNSVDSKICKAVRVQDSVLIDLLERAKQINLQQIKEDKAVDTNTREGVLNFFDPSLRKLKEHRCNV